MLAIRFGFFGSIRLLPFSSHVVSPDKRAILGHNLLSLYPLCALFKGKHNSRNALHI